MRSAGSEVSLLTRRASRLRVSRHARRRCGGDEGQCRVQFPQLSFTSEYVACLWPTLFTIDRPRCASLCDGVGYIYILLLHILVVYILAYLGLRSFRCNRTGEGQVLAMKYYCITTIYSFWRCSALCFLCARHSFPIPMLQKNTQA